MSSDTETVQKAADEAIRLDPQIAAMPREQVVTLIWEKAKERLERFANALALCGTGLRRRPGFEAPG